MKKQSNTKENSILEKIRGNYQWIIAILGIGSAITFAILKFIKYLNVSFVFEYYNINKNLIDYNNNNIYDIAISTIIFSLFYIVLYNMQKIQSLKKEWRSILKYFILNLSISPIIIGFNLKCLLFSVMMLFSEYILSRIFNNFEEREDKSKRIYITQELITLVIIILTTFYFFKFNEVKTLKDLKTYQITEENKVILHTTENYYFVADYELKNKGKTLLIFKDRQNKISNLNMETTMMTFKKVIIE